MLTKTLLQLCVPTDSYFISYLLELFENHQRSGEIYFTSKLTAYCLLFSHLVAVAGNNTHYTGLVKSETGASGVRLD